MFRLLNRQSASKLNKVATTSGFSQTLAHQSKTMTAAGFRYKATNYQQSNKNSKAANNLPEEYITLEEEEARARRVIENIEKFRTSVETNTQEGRKLSRKISNEFKEDHFVRKQRYEIFMDKMSQMYRSQKRFNKKVSRGTTNMRQAMATSQVPLQKILSEYNKLTQQGFDCRVSAIALKQLSMALEARGERPKLSMDISTPELDNNHRMTKLTDDLMFGLDKHQFFSPINMAKTSRYLGKIEHKNIELIPMWFEKLQEMMQEKISGKPRDAAEFTFEQAVYGNKLGFIPRHYIFQGFKDHEEFSEHLNTLMQWEEDADLNSSTRQRPASEKEKEAEELTHAIASVIQAAEKVKEMQIGQQASIDSLRTQYFKLLEAQDKHGFIQENKYVVYDMLELQELLVEGGYLNPTEKDQPSTYKYRMDRAADIFYDQVNNFNPDLMSPTYDEFYAASMASKKQIKPKQYPEVKISGIEKQNQIQLDTMSSVIVGAHQQALSYRREVSDHDYPNDFYRNYLLHHDTHFKNMDPSHEHYRRPHEVSHYVRMDRSYLKPWNTYLREADKLSEPFLDWIKDSNLSVEGCLRGYRALSALKLDAGEQREKLTKYLAKNGHNSVKMQNAIVDGLFGLADSSYKTKGEERVIKEMISKLQPNKLNFNEKIEALWAISQLAVKFDNGSIIKHQKKVKEILEELEVFTFERSDNHLTMKQYDLLLDFYNALSLYRPSLKINNNNLRLALEGSEFHKTRFPELASHYDPLKERILDGFSQGLTHASIEHTNMMSKQLESDRDQDFNLNKHLYPYQPDMVIGYKGFKIGLTLSNSVSTMRDSYKPDGTLYNRLNMIKKAHKNNQNGDAQHFIPVVIPLDQIADFDLDNYKFSLREGFDLMKALDNAVQEHGLQDKLSNFADFRDLNTFTTGLLGRLTQLILANNNKNLQKLDNLLQKIYETFQTKHQTELQYEPERIAAGNDEVKFKVMQLNMLHDNSLTPSEKDLVQELLPSQYSSFKEMLQASIEGIKAQNFHKKYVNKNLDTLETNWVGTRQSVELPINRQEQNKKAIEPEILSQTFMWVGDYAHYADWKEQIEGTYDQFNMMEVVPHKEQFKYYYDLDSRNRQVPQGIFPMPNYKRQVLKPASATYEKELIQHQGGNDAFTEFEKNPYKQMVLRELQRSISQKEINNDLSMIVNLTNMKQGLKADYSDQELAQTILLNLNFTDDLIEEHLANKTGKNQDNTQFVNRDARAFRDFFARKYTSKEQEDPFTHYYLKEASKQERVKILIEQDEKLKETLHDENQPEAIERRNAKSRQIWERIEEMLVENERENEDNFNLSKTMTNRIRLDYNMKSLIRSEFIQEVDPDLANQTMTDEQFLSKQRRRAEQKLIKSKIVYKTHHDIPLSKQETKYLKAWIKEISDTGKSLKSISDSMLPDEHTSRTIKDMSAEDVFTLNSIPRVEIDRKKHNNYAINDIVLELSHFLDQDLVEKVNLSLLSGKMRDEWGLHPDFQLVETRNKEIDQVINQLEEVVWRASGEIDDKDYNDIKRMFSVKRNQDAFDKAYYDNDMTSMADFIKKSNAYDNRYNLLSEWLARKEKEYKSRVNLPPKHLQKTDDQLFAQYDKNLKKAREQLVAKMVNNDQGQQKEYKDLTSLELHGLAENLAIRLYLFDYDYPKFLPQSIKAIMEHENLNAVDRHLLESYCRIFELDWRGDQTFENKDEMMATHPIYLTGTNTQKFGKLDADKVSNMIRKACVPFLDDLTQGLHNNVKK